MSVRTTIAVDEALMERIRRLIPRHGLDRFVFEATAYEQTLRSAIGRRPESGR